MSELVDILELYSLKSFYKYIFMHIITYLKNKGYKKKLTELQVLTQQSQCEKCIQNKL